MLLEAADDGRSSRQLAGACSESGYKNSRIERPALDWAERLDATISGPVPSIISKNRYYWVYQTSDKTNNKIRHWALLQSEAPCLQLRQEMRRRLRLRKRLQTEESPRQQRTLQRRHRGINDEKYKEQQSKEDGCHQNNINCWCCFNETKESLRRNWTRHHLLHSYFGYSILRIKQ